MTLKRVLPASALNTGKFRPKTATMRLELAAIK
jgi:hypothetical protein